MSGDSRVEGLTTVIKPHWATLTVSAQPLKEYVKACVILPYFSTASILVYPISNDVFVDITFRNSYLTSFHAKTTSTRLVHLIMRRSYAVQPSVVSEESSRFGGEFTFRRRMFVFRRRVLVFRRRMFVFRRRFGLDYSFDSKYGNLRALSSDVIMERSSWNADTTPVG